MENSVPESPGLDLWPPRTRAGLDPNRPGELAERLDELRRIAIAEPGRKEHAHLVTLDLGQIRARWGRRWTERGSKALAHVESCVAHRLAPEEVYLVVDETTVWVFVAGEPWAEADRRGRTIAAEITERLLGAVPGGAAVGVRTLPLDPDALRGVVTSAVLQERVAAQKRRHAAFEKQAFARQAEQLIALYRPILSLAAPRVEAYRVFARLAGTGTTMLRPETVCAERATGAFEAALDAWYATRVAEQLAKPGAASQSALLLLPVSPATLADPDWRREWLEALHGVPPAAFQRLALELVAAEPTAPPASLAALAPELAERIRFALIRCPIDPDLVAKLAGEEGRGVSFDASGLDPATADTGRRLAAVAAACRDAGLRSLVINATSVALAEQARAAGIDYLAGDACLPPLRAPGRVVCLAAA